MSRQTYKPTAKGWLENEAEYKERLVKEEAAFKAQVVRDQRNKVQQIQQAVNAKRAQENLKIIQQRVAASKAKPLAFGVAVEHKPVASHLTHADHVKVHEQYIAEQNKKAQKPKVKPAILEVPHDNPKILPKSEGIATGSRERDEVVTVREAMKNAEKYNPKKGLGLWKKMAEEAKTAPKSFTPASGSRERDEVIAVREAMKNAEAYHPKKGLHFLTQQKKEVHVDPTPSTAPVLKV